MNEALANRLVDFTLQIPNQDLTRQELVGEFQRILNIEVNARIDYARENTINECIKSIKALSHDN